MIIKNRIDFVFENLNSLQKVLDDFRSEGLSIGFVPTMGALHDGHLSLVRQAAAENDRVIISIFVNPTQFNNPDDLKNYPRTLEKDLKLLEQSSCDLVFAPGVEVIYPDGLKSERPLVDLGYLEECMEGKFRPGHFNGVVQVVYRLFDIVKPDSAYFGEKDFQQLAVIREMTKQLKLPVRIEACPTLRESDGLAMSSRNLLLTDEYRREAPIISRALFYIRDNWMQSSVDEIRLKAIQDIEKNNLLKVEYLEIVDSMTLKPIHDWHETEHIRCCAAVFAGKVRLIDNVGIVTAQ
ncbi:MAG: pantoate--beta-alanine ligase [Bacteroidetes bacterium]|nr:MAG: pantoate--beta-alanine ligase [Bacteroidota bacterium]REK03455.1 MAG: pantoate--beta-alanine ligase [Bacteroidota bacterium]REK34760.1 MAG: pantoate--beta-alanine ligase [Bacteroidota bacterium]REK51362.1 MAG: pantoate--beta-alanine ligase [Bacteroidota bacterium]